MPQYKTTHIWKKAHPAIKDNSHNGIEKKKKTCHNNRQLTYEQNTCHNIRQLTYEKQHMPHYKTTHIWKTHATIEKIKQLTYEKTHATI